MTLSVTDRMDILDVITRADQAASSRDAEAYVRLFTEEAVLDGTQGRHAGRAALRDAVGPVWAAEGPVTLHLTLNPVVTALDSDSDDSPRASVQSTLLIIDPSPPITIRAAAAITQVLQREKGSWFIARRTVAAPGTAGR
jgi:uncharacterized protein (TIGR02246 family)